MKSLFFIFLMSILSLCTFLVVNDIKAQKSTSISKKRYFLIGFSGTTSKGGAFSGGYDTVLITYPSIDAFVKVFEKRYFIHGVVILGVTEYGKVDRKIFWNGRIK